MKKLFLLPLALGSVLLSSCQDEDFGYESSKIAYEKTMSQMLGEVAPDQTWVNAEQGYVTISEECQNVKVFDGLTGKVIANYDNLRPGSKVYYNSTIGYNPTISNGAVAMEVKNGQEVSFMAAGGSVVPKIEVGDDYKVSFSLDLIHKDIFRQEGIPDEINNFEFVPTSTSPSTMLTFDVYPLYWNTIDELTVGLYYYDPITKEKVDWDTPVYQNRKANYESGILQNRKYQERGEEYVNIGDCDDSRYKTDGSSKSQTFRVKPISVTIPANLVFGFYVQSNDGPRYYANPALNKPCSTDNVSVCNCGVHASAYAVTSGYRTDFYAWQDGAYRGEVLYVGLSADHDDNNEIILGGTKTKPITQPSRNIYFAITNVRTINYETSSYTLCFEDLGATSWQDMDFNDCVLKLTCANGQKTAGLQLLAAGGVLPIKVTYNGTSVWNEIHAALGKDLVPVNANKFKTGVTKDVETADAVSATITLPDSWTIQSLVAKIGLDVDGKTQVSIPETTGDYPKGFAVAGDFQWPGEQQNITTVYGDFSTWAAKPDFSYWYPWSAE